MKRTLFIALAVVVLAIGTGDVSAQSCPLPPNPNFAPCPLAVDRSTLQERDVDMDGLPDNFGSTGGFCGGTSAADCVGFGTAEVVLDLIIPNPATQSVTCSAPNLDVWFMGDSCSGCLATGFQSATLPAGSTTDTTIKVVVADVNGDACVCGPLLTCTFSKEAVCDDGADGDGDGLIDAADPDCCFDSDNDGFCGASDCDDAHPLIHAVPNPIDGLRVVKDGTTTEVVWQQEPAEFYDVLSGNLSDLRTSQYLNTFCEFDDLVSGSYEDMRPDPAVGDGYYYLVRSQNSCGDGGVAPSGIDPDPRAELVENPPVCPYCSNCVSTNCNLMTGAPCAPGQSCGYAGFGYSTCVAAGTGVQGDFCIDSSECANGFACINTQFGPACSRWCQNDSDCTGFADCLPLFPPANVDGVEYGVCIDLF